MSGDFVVISKNANIKFDHWISAIKLAEELGADECCIDAVESGKNRFLFGNPEFSKQK